MTNVEDRISAGGDHANVDGPTRVSSRLLHLGRHAPSLVGIAIVAVTMFVPTPCVRAVTSHVGGQYARGGSQGGTFSAPLAGPSGAKPQTDGYPSETQAQTRLTRAASFADDNNDFALAVYEQLRHRPGNLFFSPFSLRTGLTMAYAGARGETASQMSDTLRLSLSGEALHRASGAIIQRLNTAGGGTQGIVVANSLWAQSGTPLQPGFLELITRHYGGGMHSVDFRRATESARLSINRSVEERTRRKIRELVPATGLGDDTRLVLANAVYFKARWLTQFSRAATSNRPFHVEGGGTVTAPFMFQQEYMSYLRGTGYQAIDLEYRGLDLSMLVLLPDQNDGLGDLETALSARMLRDCVAKMESREVKVFLPRFKISGATVDLRDQLTALGMARAFDRNEADFSGINGRQPPDEEALYLSSVFHKAFVVVNEEGTEAAAATAAIPTLGAALNPPKPRVFRADHPFLFAIRDQKSGAILFLGRVVNPTLEN